MIVSRCLELPLFADRGNCQVVISFKGESQLPIADVRLPLTLYTLLYCFSPIYVSIGTGFAVSCTSVPVFIIIKGNQIFIPKCSNGHVCGPKRTCSLIKRFDLIKFAFQPTISIIDINGLFPQKNGEHFFFHSAYMFRKRFQGANIIGDWSG